MYLFFEPILIRRKFWSIPLHRNALIAKTLKIISFFSGPISFLFFRRKFIQDKVHYIGSQKFKTIVMKRFKNRVHNSYSSQRKTEIYLKHKNQNKVDAR